MDAYETIDVYLSISNRIDLQWGLFITVHMALFGGIIYVDRPLRLLEKAGTATIYAGFAFINYLVMKNQVVLLGFSLQDIVILSSDDCCQNLNVIQRLATEEKNGKTEFFSYVLAISHLIMFILATFSIITDSALPKDKNGG